MKELIDFLVWSDIIGSVLIAMSVMTGLPIPGMWTWPPL
jgi:hypothetical protein